LGGGDDDFSRSSAGTLVFILAVRYRLLVGQASTVFLISTVLSARILPARIDFVFGAGWGRFEKSATSPMVPRIASWLVL
jgi:hypothetical protein